MKIKINYSQNFSPKTRVKSNIKFIIIHYTGMQSEIASINRLKNIKSKVSCHYFINRKGSITQMVKDNQVAWHSGKSKWKSFINLNKYSIGIELVNKGHDFGYESFTNLQIKRLVELCLKLKKKYKIKTSNIVGHSDIAPFRKIDPGEKFPWIKLEKNNLGICYKKSILKTKQLKNEKTEKLFFRNLHKIGYRYFNLSKRNKNDIFVVKAFQRRFIPNEITGLIDQKTYIISQFLAKNSKK